MTCVCCGGDHDSHKCPMFGSAQEYLREFAPRVGPPPQSLPRKPELSLFEELFGKEIGLLQDVVDDEETYDADERSLASRLLSGHRLADLSADDRARLDSIARGLAGVPAAARRHQPAHRVPSQSQEHLHEEEEDGPTGTPDSALNRAFPALMNNDDTP